MTPGSLSGSVVVVGAIGRHGRGMDVNTRLPIARKPHGLCDLRPGHFLRNAVSLLPGPGLRSRSSEIEPHVRLNVILCHASTIGI
jgi:hypothetical protein